jgi:hypothetical protein
MKTVSFSIEVSPTAGNQRSIVCGLQELIETLFQFANFF